MVAKKKITDKKKRSEFGYKKPPKAHRFKPGQSGNPEGPPIRKVQLWNYLCEYMNMTDAEIEKLDRSKLTQSQQTALKLVENAKNGAGSGSERLARHVFDREEGKTVEHLIIDNENILTDEECDQIRELLDKNANG